MKLTVKFDTCWHNISSGRRYESSYAYAFIIGVIYEGFIGMVFYSKLCLKCDAVDKGVGGIRRTLFPKELQVKL